MNKLFNEMKYMAELAEGNPGSMAVLAKMMKEGPKIDPQSSSPILAIGILQESGVTGGKIWELYKDVCGENLVNLLALLRHIQVGFSKAEDIFEHKDMDKMLSEVMAEFTKFNRCNNRSG